VRCIIAGGREHEDPALLHAALAACPFTDRVTSIVAGMARGVPIAAYPANWKLYGRRAGPPRNTAMAKAADALIAIPGAGVGTRHMIATAIRYGLLVYVHSIVVHDSRLTESRASK